MKSFEFQPAQMLAASFLAAILVGTVVLSLPFAVAEGSIPLVDALFTATSAVCVTGLIVKDTPVDFTPAGQVVILLLFQLGGLGIMTFSTLVILAAGGRISIRDRLLVQSGYHPGIPRDFRSLVRSLFAFTLAIEAAGAALLFVWFSAGHSAGRAAALAVFHSVSAFCNAGFSLFSDSLTAYRGHAGLNLTMIGLIVLGGIGFPVLREAREIAAARLRGRRVKASLHLKLVAATTAVLIAVPFALLYLQEADGALASCSGRERVLASLFQSVTARTAGFNTIDTAALGSVSFLLLLVLMFIGASPASTGGGIKTSTAAVLALFLRARIRARESVAGFGRTVPAGQILSAFTLFVLALTIIFLAAGALLASQPGMGLREAVFEVFSAFGTVGLSMGATAGLTTAGKIVIILTMFVGRVGPLTLLYAISRRRADGRFEYAEENVLIG
jgi:trk system potassium uptake protein